MKDKYFQTIHLLIMKGHWITEQVSKELKEFGSSEPQYNVLRILKQAQGEPITVQTIQSNKVQKSSNVTRIIDKLQVKGLVKRVECQTNRRKMDLTITPLGNEFLTKLDKKVRKMHKPLMEKLSESKLTQMYKLLNKFRLE